jgi:hypothetical protein
MGENPSLWGFILRRFQHPSYIETKGIVIDELERIWQENFVA